MKLINKVLKYVISFSIIFATILTIIDICSFDKNFYHKQFDKNNTSKTIGTDKDNLTNITNNLLDYLKNKNDDINITYIKNGKITDVYQDIEIIHMSDVKKLYQSFLVVKTIFIVLSIFGFIYLFINKISFRKEFNYSLFLIIFALGLLIISCIIDFNSFWISFHKIFFTKNDYWLLDPKTCILVNLFTSDFFFSLCTKICVISIIAILLIYIIINYYEKKKFN